MKQKNTFYTLIIILFVMVSCNSQPSKQPTIDTPTTNTSQDDDYDSPVMDEMSTMGEGEEADLSNTDEQQQETPKNKTAKTKTQSTSMSGKETLYISTYGANGKVWGHVTLNGNHGRGTIHDDDENSYTITVTRHGGELHGIDQNGREYVFRM